MSKLITVIIACFLFVTGTTWADSYIYDQPYGGRKTSSLDKDGFFYDGAYGGKKIGRAEDGKLYDSPFGGPVIDESDSKNAAGYWLLEEGEE